MVRLNKKGFTFVEILAVVAIMGILSGIAIIGVSKYREKQVNLNYESLAKSSYNAFQNYEMKNGETSYVKLQDLKDEDFLNNLIDPRNKGNDCNGYVSKYTDEEKNEKYQVDLCCINYSKRYVYPDNTVSDLDSCVEPEVIDPSTLTYTVTYVCGDSSNNIASQR